jgi:6-phosphogluconolactonase
MTPELHVDPVAALVHRLARDFQADVSATLQVREYCSVALPGGSVALQCFPALAALTVDWRRLQFFFVDERAVPPRDRDSNFALARRLWFAPAGVPDTSVFRMPAEQPDLSAAAVQYAEQLRGLLGDRPVLDYVLLGVGPEGHVASLFPGHRALADPRSVVAVTDAPKPPPRRLTMTLPVLCRARRIAIAAFGEEKADALHEALEGRRAFTPVAEVLRRASRSLVLADPDAGRRLHPHLA